MRTPFHESLMFSFACVPHRFLHAVFPQGKGFYPYQPIVSLSLMFTTFTRLYVSRFTASYARFLFSLSLLSWLRFATPLYRIGKGISIAPLPPYFSDLNPSNVVGRRKAKGQVPTRPKTTTKQNPPDAHTPPARASCKRASSACHNPKATFPYTQKREAKCIT